VVAVGIFARHRARVCLLGTSQGVKTLSFWARCRSHRRKTR